MGPPTPPSTDKDRALVGAVLARAPGAFEALVRDHQRLCWSIINRMVRHPEDTRELCQEAFLRVHRHLDQFRFESPLRSWIGRVAFSVAARHLKRKRIPLAEPLQDEDGESLIEQAPDDFDLEAAYADAELIGHMREEIEKLPPLQRTVLTMYHMEELPVGEIASVCGLPEGTIKSHLFRSRIRLRERLQARLDGTS
jgi:RNA polymerase sigma-70 factor (ECF subfamily)